MGEVNPEPHFSHLRVPPIFINLGMSVGEPQHGECASETRRGLWPLPGASLSNMQSTGLPVLQHMELTTCCRQPREACTQPQSPFQTGVGTAEPRTRRGPQSAQNQELLLRGPSCRVQPCQAHFSHCFPFMQPSWPTFRSLRWHPILSLLVSSGMLAPHPAGWAWHSAQL